MPSADESSSSSIVYQEKPPIADHDSASITPRWAPAIPDVPSLGSPFARVAGSICCSFGWQQPAGYEALPPPTAVVYDPPQQPVMEVLPPMPNQTTNSLQHTVPDNGESPQQALLPNDQFNLNSLIVPISSELSQQASLSTDLLSLNPLQNITSNNALPLEAATVNDQLNLISLPHVIPDNEEQSQRELLQNDQRDLNSLQNIMPQARQLLQQGPISNNLLNLNCLQSIAPDNGQSSQQPVFSNDLFNFESLPLDMYPAIGDASMQNLPHSGYTNQFESTSHEQHSQLNPRHNTPSQLASSDSYKFPMNQVIIAVTPMDEIPIGGAQVIGGSSPLRHGPAPDLRPAHPLLVDIETTSSNMYNYNSPSAQNLRQPTTQLAMLEDRANAAAQKQYSTVENQQRNGKRGPFRDQALREQTAQTRRMGSCLRCRMQRIRCEFDVPGGCCLPCKKVENTKAARLPCLRYKITDMTLYKTGQVPGYEWTQRWTKGTSDPIQLWASSEIRTVYVSVCHSKERLPLKVRRFVPQQGDKLERTWAYGGAKKSALIPPYALVDVEAGTSAYTAYIRSSMKDIFQTMLGSTNDLLYKTYLLAYRMWQKEGQKEERTSEVFELLNWTLRLWVAIRLSTTSAFIVGEETLDMPANILDESSPDHGKIPLPPVMGAQMDMILIHHIQNKLRHELLDNLQKVMLRNKPTSWLVTYLVSFILLHNIALITKHDASYAKKHGMNRRFAREEKVREYHMGANVILAHFHYCNKGRVPFSEHCEDKDLRALAQLDEEKIQFVRATRALVQRHQQEWKEMRSKEKYEDDYFFVSQLFDEKWQPSSTNV
ncbi:hypothetical protein GGI43DRAFT_402305 [Trichoderma evansii]